MFLTDVYRVVKESIDRIDLDRAILPNIVIFIVIGLGMASLTFILAGKPNVKPWLWFSSIGLGLTVYGIAYLLIPDKRITLEKDGSVFVLRGKHWFRNRYKAFSASGEMIVARVVSSEGDRAINYILEVKTQDGLRILLGFHGFGSFNKSKLEELGRLLEKKTSGRLVLKS